MRTDVSLLTKEDGGSPTRNPSTATEDARVASLISLEDIYKQTEVQFEFVNHQALQVASYVLGFGVLCRVMVIVMLQGMIFPLCYMLFSEDLIGCSIKSLTQEMQKELRQKGTTANKKMGYLRRLDGLEERMSTLLSVDHPAAQKCILETRDFVEVSACFLHGLNICDKCNVAISLTWRLVFLS